MDDAEISETDSFSIFINNHPFNSPEVEKRLIFRTVGIIHEGTNSVEDK
jgi:hypothetical protein